MRATSIRQCRLWIALAGAGLILGGAMAASPVAREYQIKAAFLFQFLKFVEFPKPADKEFRKEWAICIVGKDPLGEAMESTLEGKTVDDRTIRIHRHETLKELHDSKADAQLVYFSPLLPEAEVIQAIKELKSRPCLTVGETPAFCESGGMIKLRIEDNRVRFDANPTAAALAGVRISSQLLRLASHVISSGSPAWGAGEQTPMGKTP